MRSETMIDLCMKPYIIIVLFFSDCFFESDLGLYIHVAIDWFNHEQLGLYFQLQYWKQDWGKANKYAYKSSMYM